MKPLRRLIGRFCALTLCAAALITGMPARAATSTCLVKTDGLNLRSSPSTTASVLAELPTGTSLSIISSDTEWLKVKYDSITGYVNGKHVTVSAAVKSSTETKTTAAAVTPPNKKRTDVKLKQGDVSDDVLDLQDALRKKGYFTNPMSTEFGYYTQKALELFQKKNNLPVNGIADTRTLKALYGKRTDLPEKIVYDYTDYIEMDEPNDSSSSSSTDSGVGQAIGEVEATLVNRDVKLVDWWSGDIQKAIPRGATVTITDAETGVKFKSLRFGGSNHADMEPLTKEDTAAMKRARGGEWGWSARAVYVTINGQTFAAAMNGQPHGGSSVADNNFNGHFCLHFLNSRTHRTNRKNPDMQERVMEAFEAAGDR